MEVNKIGNVVSSSALKDLLIKPNILFAFLITAEVCFFFYHVHSFDVWAVLSFPILMLLHFSSLKGRFHLCDHCYMLFISHWSDVLSVFVLILVYILVSSANSLQLLWTEFGISLIKMTNKIGPSTEPCGTPLFAQAQFESLPSTVTLYFLSDKNVIIHWST